MILVFWQAFGCPGEDGYWSKGTFRSPDFRNRRQMIPNLGDPPVQKGFSGGPVFLDEQDLVTVGMVVAIYPQHQNRSAFMLPTDMLKNAIGIADTVVLSEYLSSARQIIWSTIKQVYQKCLPEIWDPKEPEKLVDILHDLAQNVPDAEDGNGQVYSGLSWFIAGTIN